MLRVLNLKIVKGCHVAVGVAYLKLDVLLIKGSFESGVIREYGPAHFRLLNTLGISRQPLGMLGSNRGVLL